MNAGSGKRNRGSVRQLPNRDPQSQLARFRKQFAQFPTASAGVGKANVVVAVLENKHAPVGSMAGKRICVQPPATIANSTDQHAIDHRIDADPKRGEFRSCRRDGILPGCVRAEESGDDAERTQCGPTKRSTPFFPHVGSASRDARGNRNLGRDERDRSG